MRSTDPIHRLPDGRYRVRVDAGFHPDGRRRQIQSTHATLREARSALAQTLSAVRDGTYIGKNARTVSQQFDVWLEGKRRIRPTTRQHYRDVCVPLLAAYGDLPVQRLTRRHLETLVSELLATGGTRGKGRSVSYVRSMLIALGQALDEAVREHLVAVNVARLVELPEAPIPQPVTWTKAQVDTFLRKIEGDRLEALWRLTMAGLRRGEVLGLTWANVDLSVRVIHIRATRVNVRGGQADSLPKTRRGERSLPIWDALAAALPDLRGFELLATLPTGEPIKPRWYADQFKLLAAEYGLPVIPLKNARHTSITLMRNAGIPDHVVAAWHGHDESVMRSTYTDAKPYLAQIASFLTQDVNNL
jgi:integrase